MSKKCPTMASLGRKWKRMKPAQRSKYHKSGKKSAWNQFVAQQRKGCKN